MFPSWLNVTSPLTHVEYGWTLIASNTSDTVGNRIRTTSVDDFIITLIWHETQRGAYVLGGWSTAVHLLENEVETFLGLSLSKRVHRSNTLSGMIVFSWSKNCLVLVTTCNKKWPLAEIPKTLGSQVNWDLGDIMIGRPFFFTWFYYISIQLVAQQFLWGNFNGYSFSRVIRS